MATSIFKSLVDTTHDSVAGYETAVSKATDPALQQSLGKLLEQRKQTLATMNSELQRQGDELITEGTVTGAAHRVWTDITDAFEDSNEAAVERVEEGESYLAGKFEKALESGALDTSERSIVEGCLPEIKQSCQFSKMLEQAYD